jgi:hypothetical protein
MASKKPVAVYVCQVRRAGSRSALHSSMGFRFIHTHPLRISAASPCSTVRQRCEQRKDEAKRKRAPQPRAAAPRPSTVLFFFHQPRHEAGGAPDLQGVSLPSPMGCPNLWIPNIPRSHPDRGSSQSPPLSILNWSGPLLERWPPTLPLHRRSRLAQRPQQDVRLLRRHLCSNAKLPRNGRARVRAYMYNTYLTYLEDDLNTLCI